MRDELETFRQVQHKFILNAYLTPTVGRLLGGLTPQCHGAHFLDSWALPLQAACSKEVRYETSTVTHLQLEGRFRIRFIGKAWTSSAYVEVRKLDDLMETSNFYTVLGGVPKRW